MYSGSARQYCERRSKDICQRLEYGKKYLTLLLGLLSNGRMIKYMVAVVHN